MRKFILITTAIYFLFVSINNIVAGNNPPFKLPDTGQTGKFTSTTGEDSDFTINPMSFKDNGDGTITDNVTGLMWQKTDGGEMTVENAATYCKSLSLAGYNDWRLPTCIELFSINNYDYLNPALNTTYFTKTAAEYWWTTEVQVDDATKVWVVNSGGGIGAHPKSETVSAGGAKKFHFRCVRNTITYPSSHFTDNTDGTITDNYTGLLWQKIQNSASMTWEEALAYAKNLTLAGKSDWRLPNVKELQSLNDVKLSKPSFDKKYFTNSLSGNFWSSTTMSNKSTVAWDINIDYGIVSYNDKTKSENVLLVRGGIDNTYLSTNDVLIPGGEYDMGDHFGFVDPGHPSDETPVHKVKVDSFYISKYELTNKEYLDYLNSALQTGLIEVKSNIVYLKGTSTIICYTNQYESWYSIGYDGTKFSMSDFRANHPMVGVMWSGAAAYCNWLSLQNGYEECYNLKSWICDFTKNGYRLPTEAEWEYAGRGGHTNPYYNYPNGNTIDISSVNLPNSGDPYETGAYPNTTPVGFYDGNLKLKSDYNWPGTATSYQTTNGVNGYGLYDMEGNAWEFVNDWYGQDYYSKSPYDNPKGPDSTFKMPDGKPYRGMRGGNWYNGLVVNGINDGHSRVSNRNPSYYRGPQDPNHPYYHLGFRVARNYTGISNNPPNTPDKPVGIINGIINEIITFTTKTTDVDGDSVAYYFDWGDGTNSGWSSFNKSGVQISGKHSWISKGIYSVKVKAKDVKNAESGYSDTLTVYIDEPQNHQPEKPETPNGDTSGIVNKIITYKSKTTDVDGDSLSYYFDWGDSTNSGWIGIFSSGMEISSNHSWTAEGKFKIKVKARDSKYAESEWSDSLFVNITKETSVRENPISHIDTFSQKIYPNPASDFIFFMGQSSYSSIFNVFGSVVWNGYVESNSKIDISKFDNGIYILKNDYSINRFIIIK